MIINFRKHDPPSSKLAGRYVQASGLAQSQRDRCLAVVKRIPGLTAREIEDRLGIKAHKRLPELRFDGLVRNGQVRACTISGRQALTWKPNYNN